MLAWAILVGVAVMGTQDPWVRPEAKYRRPVYLDGSQLAGDLEGFPLLVRLTPQEFDLFHLQPDGGGLTVVDGATGRALPHRLELLPGQAGAALWVRMACIQGRNIASRLWLYYPDPDAPLLPAADLLDERTLALRFAGDAQGRIVTRSPGSELHLEGQVALADGLDGPALELAGEGVVRLTLPERLHALDSTAWTLEAFAYDTCPNPSMGVGHGLISLWAEEGRTEPLINFGKVGHVLHSDARRGPTGAWVGATNFGYAPPGRWFHYAAVYDLTAGKVVTYLNGQRTGEGTAPSQALPITSARIGGWAPHVFSFQGRIAEVRIATVARSPDWLVASAANVLPEGRLAILGPEQERGRPAPPPDDRPPVCQQPLDGATVLEIRPRLRWSLVPSTDRYRVTLSTQPDLSEPLWEGDTGAFPSLTCPLVLPQGVPLYWQVRTPGGRPSAIARFTVSAPEQQPRPIDDGPLAPPPLRETRQLLPGNPDAFRARGVVGERVQVALERWALRVPGDNPDLVGMFERQWHSEGWLDFWGESFGKFYQGASLLARMTGDQRLRGLLDREMARALAAQEPSGYLGALLPERRLFGPGPRGTNWDLYNGHHTLMALLEYHQATGNEAALRGAMHLADLWCDVFGPGRRSIVRDIPGPDQCNLGIIAPLAWLYRLTGRQRYLDLARFVVADLETEPGPHWVTLARAGKHCTEMRGIHALEQLFVFEGMLDLAFITGETELRDAMLHWWRDMTERERMAHGNLAPEELWSHNPCSLSWAETCVATAYIRFSLQALYATADSRCADRMEEATLNAHLGAQRPDGGLWAYPVPVNGRKPFGWYELKPDNPDLGCCFTYALTGMGLISRWATMNAPGDRPALVINYYGPSTSAATVGEVKVEVEQDTDYPCEGEVILRVRPSHTAEFEVWLRIPDWSASTRARVNQEAWFPAAAGQYLRLHRRWREGDCIALQLDFTPRVVRGTGEAEGRAAIYRGPLLLVADRRFNPDWDPNRSALDLARFSLTPHRDPVPGPQPWVLFDAPSADGSVLTLCDFASAGALGDAYEGWIPAR